MESWILLSVNPDGNVWPWVCAIKLKHTWVMERDNDPRYTSKATSDWLKKKPLCGLKSERKPVVCAQKNLPRVKKSRPKSKSVSELFHSVPRLVCTGSLPRMVLCLNFCDRLYSCLWASRDVVAAAFKWHYNSAFPFNLFVWDDPHLPKTTRCQFDKS